MALNNFFNGKTEKLMTSDKQDLANKTNAQASTGPTTAEGKKISSQNACVHGIHSKYLTAFDTDTFDAFSKNLRDEFVFESVMDDFIFEELILAVIKLHRCHKIEMEYLKEAMCPRIEHEFAGTWTTVEQEGELATVKPAQLQALGVIWEKYEPKLLSRIFKLTGKLKRKEMASFSQKL